MNDSCKKISPSLMVDALGNLGYEFIEYHLTTFFLDGTKLLQIDKKPITKYLVLETGKVVWNYEETHHFSRL